MSRSVEGVDVAGPPERNDDEIVSGINVTPLVDVVLVLLIIFIVTASLILRQAIPCSCPAPRRRRR